MQKHTLNNCIDFEDINSVIAMTDSPGYRAEEYLIERKDMIVDNLSQETPSKNKSKI